MHARAAKAAPSSRHLTIYGLACKCRKQEFCAQHAQDITVTVAARKRCTSEGCTKSPVTRRGRQQGQVILPNTLNKSVFQSRQHAATLSAVSHSSTSRLHGSGTRSTVTYDSTLLFVYLQQYAAPRILQQQCIVPPLEPAWNI